MNLRGHHLLCIFGWQGYGYSEEFNRAMDEAVRNLTRPAGEIEISAGPDQLCEKCPHLNSAGCYKDGQDKEEQIAEHDRRVLGLFGLTAGNRISVKQLKRLISQKTPCEKLADLCTGCSWLEKDYCYKGQKAAANNLS